MPLASNEIGNLPGGCGMYLVTPYLKAFGSFSLPVLPAFLAFAAAANFLASSKDRTSTHRGRCGRVGAVLILIV